VASLDIAEHNSKSKNGNLNYDNRSPRWKKKKNYSLQKCAFEVAMQCLLILQIMRQFKHPQEEKK